MTPSLSALVFIGGAAAAGIYVGTKETVIDGDVMAADLLEQHREAGLARITCEDKILVRHDGATFACQAFHSDGSTAVIRYKLTREGKLLGDVVETTRPRAPDGVDTWR